MARIAKNNADYFSHDADASSDEKIIYLESRFGPTGYALYFKMLEALCRASGFELPWSEIQAGIYARKFGVQVSEFKDFIVAATMPEICCFVIEDGKIFSNGLKKRMLPLVEKRERDAERLRQKRANKGEEGENGDDLDIVAATNQIVAATTTQSKEKESKEKESKEIGERGVTRNPFFNLGKEVFLAFYKKAMPEVPYRDFDNSDIVCLNKILDFTEAKVKEDGKKEWNEKVAKNALVAFFKRAKTYDEGDSWLQKNGFELAMLNRKKEKIFYWSNESKTGSNPVSNGVSNSGERVIKVGFRQSEIGNLEAFTDMIYNSEFFYADAEYYFNKIADHADNAGRGNEPMKRTDWVRYSLDWLKKDEACNRLVGDDNFTPFPSSGSTDLDEKIKDLF